jgi:hypothetical protein
MEGCPLRLDSHKCRTHAILRDCRNHLDDADRRWPAAARRTPEIPPRVLPADGPGLQTSGMSEIIRRRREQRRQFLHGLYEHADGSVSEFLSAYELGAALGISEPETRKIFEYLEEKGWVLVDDHRTGTLRLTAAGVDEVEGAA